jgi:hypothetical protein
VQLTQLAVEHLLGARTELLAAHASVPGR